MSEQKPLSFRQRFALVCDEMPIVGKNGTANAGKKFSYDYALLEEVQGELSPLLTKHNINYYHVPVSEGNRVGVTLVVMDLLSDDQIESTFTMELGSKTIEHIDDYNRKIVEITGDLYDVQKHGAIQTYFKRYSLVGMFRIIVSGDDNDGLTPSEKKAKKNEYTKPKPKFVSDNGGFNPKIHEKIERGFVESDVFLEEVKKYEAHGGGYDGKAKAWYLPKDKAEQLKNKINQK